jgi:NADPH-dependent 2,4-dienoyl-CoA reductase/sulfur reductase-like enzyme
MEHLCIVGNGISGITTARHVRKQKSAAECKITVISAETDHFFSRTALMYIYMGHMTYENTKPYEDFFWEKNNINLVRGYVNRIDTTNKQLVFTGREAMTYDKLVLAVGSVPNRIGWPGEELKGVNSLVSYQDLEQMEENTRNVNRAVIVGGGLIGIEMAEMLMSRNIPVTFFIREKEYWSNVLPPEEAAMVSRHARKHGLDLRTESGIKEILGDERGRVKGVKTVEDEEVSCQFVGITIGVKPAIGFLQNSNIATDRGILVNEYFETSVPDVYAAGDCAQYRNPPAGRKPLDQIWYTGRMHGETLGLTLGGRKTAYKPGIFFNSAKFFDIEYQVYGEVKPEVQEHENHFYWQHPDGEKAVRLVFHKQEHYILGFNLMGIRFRHEVCDRWIKSHTPVTDVVKNLRKANFNPELFKTYEPQIREQFNREFPDLAVKTKRNVVSAIFGL